MDPSLLLHPIGAVRSSVTDPSEMPYNGAPAVLELLPEYHAAAVGLEPSYVWVLTWLDRAERLPFREGAGGPRGSFASRTPSRLNPIGVTCARVLRIEAGKLWVDALDACDGTPLLDVKPYVRDFDSVVGPADAAWRRHPEPEQRLARIIRTIERFCGPLTSDLALAARAALEADTLLNVAANSKELVWDCRCRPEVAAGIQAVAGAPLGGPRFVLGADERTITVRHGAQRGINLWLSLTPPPTPEAILGASREVLFRSGDPRGPKAAAD
jgi:tRNA-Thr(GGU) m(6)t(6)A37 methyltransferase TsaA